MSIVTPRVAAALWRQTPLLCTTTYTIPFFKPNLQFLKQKRSLSFCFRTAGSSPTETTFPPIRNYWHQPVFLSGLGRWALQNCPPPLGGLSFHITSRHVMPCHMYENSQTPHVHACSHGKSNKVSGVPYERPFVPTALTSNFRRSTHCHNSFLITTARTLAHSLNRTCSL